MMMKEMDESEAASTTDQLGDTQDPVGTLGAGTRQRVRRYRRRIAMAATVVVVAVLAGGFVYLSSNGQRGIAATEVGTEGVGTEGAPPDEPSMNAAARPCDFETADLAVTFWEGSSVSKVFVVSLPTEWGQEVGAKWRIQQYHEATDMTPAVVYVNFEEAPSPEQQAWMEEILKDTSTFPEIEEVAFGVNPREEANSPVGC